MVAALLQLSFIPLYRHLGGGQTPTSTMVLTSVYVPADRDPDQSSITREGSENSSTGLNAHAVSGGLGDTLKVHNPASDHNIVDEHRVEESKGYRCDHCGRCIVVGVEGGMGVVVHEGRGELKQVCRGGSSHSETAIVKPKRHLTSLVNGVACLETAIESS